MPIWVNFNKYMPDFANDTKEIAEKYSKNEREHVAKKSKEFVLRDLMNIYREVIKSEGISLTL